MHKLYSMLKNKILIFTVVTFLIFSMISCIDKTEILHEDIDIEAILEELYTSSYDYTKITIDEYDKENSTLDSRYNGMTKIERVFTGTVFNAPYKEYFVFESVNYSNEIPPHTDKVYYYAYEDTIKALVRFDGAFKEVIMSNEQRPRIEGYFYKKEFKFVREDKLDGKEVFIFEGKYSKPLAAAHPDVLNSINDGTYSEEFYNEEYKYEFLQEYWIDKENKEIIKMISDITPYLEMADIFNNIQLRGLSFGEAKERYDTVIKEQNPISVQQIIKFKNIGNPTEFEIPKKEN